MSAPGTCCEELLGGAQLPHGRPAEADPRPRGLRHGVGDRAVAVPERHRPQAHAVLDVPVAVDVLHVRALTAGDHRRHALGVLVRAAGVGVRSAGHQLVQPLLHRGRRREGPVTVPGGGSSRRPPSRSRTSLSDTKPSAYRARLSMPRRRIRPENSSSSHQSRPSCEGKHRWSSSTLRPRLRPRSAGRRRSASRSPRPTWGSRSGG